MAMHNFSGSLSPAIVLLYVEAPEEAWADGVGLEAWLSPEERDRAARFRFERDRNAFVAAHALLRFALRQHTGRSDWKFDVGPQGKPSLAETTAGVSVEFNITHTPGLAACGLTTAGAVGVDAERRDRAVDVERLAERYFTVDERQRVGDAGMERGERFIQLWTVKEAVVKALGQGLSLDLQTFSVTTDPCGVRFAHGSDSAWQLGLTSLAHHSLAVALRRTCADRVALTWRKVSVSELCEALHA